MQVVHLSRPCFFFLFTLAQYSVNYTRFLPSLFPISKALCFTPVGQDVVFLKLRVTISSVANAVAASSFNEDAIHTFSWPVTAIFGF